MVDEARVVEQGPKLDPEILGAIATTLPEIKVKELRACPNTISFTFLVEVIKVTTKDGQLIHYPNMNNLPLDKRADLHSVETLQKWGTAFVADLLKDGKITNPSGGEPVVACQEAGEQLQPSLRCDATNWLRYQITATITATFESVHRFG